MGRNVRSFISDKEPSNQNSRTLWPYLVDAQGMLCCAGHRQEEEEEEEEEEEF
jgi:hypothetical protein